MSQRAAHNLANLGLVRLSGCFGLSEPNSGDLEGSYRLVLACLAKAAAIALAIHLKDVDMVCQAVEQHAGQSFFNQFLKPRPKRVWLRC